MRRLLAASFLACGVACEYDPACKAVLQYGPSLAARLATVEGTATGQANPAMQPVGDNGDLSRTLTPHMAARLLAEAEAIEDDLPAMARAEDLNMLLVKLAHRRSAFEQALRDFLAIDPSQLEKGLDSGATMPLRRGVEMSRDAMLSLADTAVEVCRMHE